MIISHSNRTIAPASISIPVARTSIYACRCLAVSESTTAWSCITDRLALSPERLECKGRASGFALSYLSIPRLLRLGDRQLG